jgi:hypothetical protein
MFGFSLFFSWWPLPLAKSGRTISSMGYLVPRSFAAGGNWVISRFIGS